MKRIPILVIPSEPHYLSGVIGSSILYLDGHIGGYWNTKEEAQKCMDAQLLNRSWLNTSINH